MSPNTLKWIPIMGIGILWMSWMFGTTFQIENLVKIGSFFAHWKSFDKYITNLTCEKLIMEIVQNSFVHMFVCFTHEYHALKTRMTHM
jgi:hypothetical protein